MTADIQASLAKLHSLSATLNEASDTLSAQLNSVEAALNKLNLGVPAWVEIDRRDAGDGLTRYQTLGYSKAMGNWGLVICEHIGGMEDEDDPMIFLRDAPRETRVLAADKIGELIEKMAENSAKTSERVTKRAAEVKEIASTLSTWRK